jgi:hypothetical protein
MTFCHTNKTRIKAQTRIMDEGISLNTSLTGINLIIGMAVLMMMRRRRRCRRRRRRKKTKTTTIMLLHT